MDPHGDTAGADRGAGRPHPAVGHTGRPGQAGAGPAAAPSPTTISRRCMRSDVRSPQPISSARWMARSGSRSDTSPHGASTAGRSARSRRCSTCWPTPSYTHRGLQERGASRRMGGRCAAGPGEAMSAASVAKAYAGRSARTVCETAIQVHGGIGNTWECTAHLYLRRALLSIELFGGIQASLTRVLASHGYRGSMMDLRRLADEVGLPRAHRRPPGPARTPPTPPGPVDGRRVLAPPGLVAPVAVRRRVLRHVVAGRHRWTGTFRASTT